MTNTGKSAKKELQPRLRFKGFTDPWEQRQLGDVAQIVGGGTPDTSNPDYWNGDINWFSPNEIGQSVYASESRRKISQSGLEHSSATLLPAGRTILFTSRAGIGDTAILLTTATTNQGFQSWVLDDHMDIYFMYCRSLTAKTWAERMAGGSTFLEVSAKTMEKMPIAIPSITEQKNIGTFFRILDSLIAAAERHLRTLALEKAAYLRRLFTAKGELQPHTRFKGFSGDWEQQKLGDLFDLDEERNDGQFPASQFISVAKMSFSDKSAAADSLNTYRVLRPGDIAFEGNRHRTHPFGQLVLNDIGVGIMSPRFRAIRPRRPLVLSFWKCLLRNEQIMRPVLIRSTKRGTIMNELVPEDLFKQKIRIPSEDEQQAIGTFFNALDSQISVSERKLEALKQLKQGYLQQMFV